MSGKGKLRCSDGISDQGQLWAAEFPIFLRREDVPWCND